MRSRMRNRLGPLRHGSTSTLVWALGTALLVGTASAGVPEQVTNIFKPLSTPAELISESAWLALAVCAGIFLVVGTIFGRIRLQHHLIREIGKGGVAEVRAIGVT